MQSKQNFLFRSLIPFLFVDTKHITVNRLISHCFTTWGDFGKHANKTIFICRSKYRNVQRNMPVKDYNLTFIWGRINMLNAVYKNQAYLKWHRKLQVYLHQIQRKLEGGQCNMATCSENTHQILWLICIYTNIQSKICHGSIT